LADSPSPKKTQALRIIANSIQERLDAERSLKAAGGRQRSMLPPVPEVPGYEFASVYLPAEQVSGDFYDIIELDGGRYGILLGDISGHGMEAGIVMGAARKALQIYARSADSPAAVLSWGNEDLSPELDRETFLTAGYSILDASAGTVRYARAGHTHPLLVGPEPGRWQLVRSGGTMIGVTRGERFTGSLEEVDLELRPGQAFVQYTDGLTEARERGGEEFGVDRLIECLERAVGPQASLSGMFAAVVAELAAWTGGAPQEDDVTILGVRRLPAAAG
jgi:sigma-B regulation protein RsbU (phosphoserine phosphatase)